VVDQELAAARLLLGNREQRTMRLARMLRR